MKYYYYGNNKHNYNLNEAVEENSADILHKKIQVFLVRFLNKLDPDTLSKVNTALLETAKEVPYIYTLIKNVVSYTQSSRKFSQAGLTPNQANTNTAGDRL